jgi:hypothetical protein
MLRCPAVVITAIGLAPVAARFVSAVCRQIMEGADAVLDPGRRESLLEGLVVCVRVEHRPTLRVAENEVVV